MSSEWHQLTIADIADINPRRPIQKGTCAPFVEMANVPTHSRDIDDTITTREHKGSGSKFQNGDTLLARITPCLENGKTALVSCLPDDVIGHGSTEFIVLAPKNENDTSFIYYLVRSDAFRDYAINRMEGTSGRQRVPTAAVASYEFRCPPPPERKELSDFLSAIDDRITLLHETNKTLESIAQAFFKSWFVDFDPVRAKKEGRQPEGMDEETAALFPSEFEESELGLVPKGWSHCAFRDTIQIIGGGTPKTSVAEYWGGDIPWFSVVDAPLPSDVFVLKTQKNITEAGLNGSATKLLPTRTTIISARGTVGRVALTGRPMTMNQSCYGLRGIAGDDYFTYFSTIRLVDQLKQRAHGSVFDTITRETFSGIHMCYPTREAILAFDCAVRPLLERVKENLEQTQTLAILRDTLLPRLISGQLRLPEAEAIATEACI